MTERTRREVSATATRRDVAPESASSAPGSVPGRVQLPPELVEQGYKKRDELACGAEADLVLVAGADGAEHVAKLYRPGLSFDETATDLLVTADQAHVIRIHETGFSPAWNQRFEILEYCPLGSLRDVFDNGHRLDPVEVVRELSSALEHIHSLPAPGTNKARLVHQDLKPENVLVRSLAPLDLVLGDFGLSRTIAGTVHLTSRQQGSRAYAPPPGEAVSTGWDWWSLGMLIAELAAGAHPFNVDGSWISTQAVDHLLSQGPPDVSAVPDARLQSLCQGLMTRRIADRWGADEVARWLAGESVPVAADRGAQRNARAVLFNGTEYNDPQALALAFQSDWEQALQQLIQRSDQTLVVEVEMMLSSAQMTGALQLLQPTNRSHPDTRLANLLLAMNSELPPTYRDADVRPLALAHGLRDPSTADDTARLIDDLEHGLIKTRILSSWRTQQGMEEAVSIERRLIDANTYLSIRSSLLADLPETVRFDVRKHLYSVAITPNTAEQHRRAVASIDTTLAREQAWWRGLADEPDDFAAVVARFTEETARRQTNADVARREAHERSLEAKRKADEERRERERREREQAEERSRRDARAATARRRWRFWAWPLLLLFATTSWLGAGTLGFVHQDEQSSLGSMLSWPYGFGWVAKTYDWWAQTAPDWILNLDWARMDAESDTALWIGIGLLLLALTTLVLSVMSFKGKGINRTGRLSRVVVGLTVLLVPLGLASAIVFLPWTVAGLSAVAAVIGTIALTIGIIWFLLALFFN